MTWRDIWKSTVTNLRALLGFPTPSRPPSASAFSTPSSSQAAIVKRDPTPLGGPLIHPNRPDQKSYPLSQAVSHTANQPPHSSPPLQIIDLAATRPMPSISAPLRRKPNITHRDAHVDVALDAAAFAAVQGQRLEIIPAPPVPEIGWTRQGVAQIEQPATEIEDGDGGPFDHDDPSDRNGYGGNGGGYRADESDESAEEGVALTTLLESLLFVASEPVEPRQLAQTLAQPLQVIELGLAELADYYQRTLRGVRIQRFQDKVQLVTAPDAAPFIELFLNLDNSTRLSSPALETLAVIAYRQPVTRAQIEAVRGVDCAGVLRTLVQRGLVVEMGRMEGLGRPILYGVTELFMQHFGLMEMTELPPLEETDADRLWAATVIDEQDLADGKNR